MKEELISLNTAKLAKEKGFNIPVNGVYVDNGTLSFARDNDETDYNWNERKGYSAPTQSLLQKWLREVHRIHIAVMPWSNTTWWYQVEGIEIYNDPNGALLSNSCTESDTYEEALECGLLKSLGLIKQ